MTHAALRFGSSLLLLLLVASAEACTFKRDLLTDSDAEVRKEGDAFWLHDLGSANGVHVNGQRIRATAEVVDGDTIRIGSQQFTFQKYPPTAGGGGRASD